MPTIDRSYLIDRTVKMVQIDSRNPSLTPGSPGEKAMAAYIAAELDALGLVPTIYEEVPGRPSVVSTLKGTGDGPTLLLNAHMDTVGVEGMADPFSGEVRDGRIYGRGSQDMKGSLAAQLACLKALIDAGVQLKGDLIYTAVSDEEYASIGSYEVARQVKADAAIVTEPTDLDLCRAHRGFIIYEVKTIGRAAHGSRYHEGIDANMRMGRFLGELEKLEQDLLHRTPHPLTGPPSLHAGVLRGGTEASVYAAECVLEMERRTIPGETVPGATRELQAIIDHLAAADPTFKAALHPAIDRPPFETGAETAIVKTTDQAIQARLGRSNPHVGALFWTDAAVFAAAGMDAVLLGPVGQGLHSAVEWVDIDSLVDLAAILADTAIHYCQRAD